MLVAVVLPTDGTTIPHPVPVRMAIKEGSYIDGIHQPSFIHISLNVDIIRHDCVNIIKNEYLLVLLTYT